MSRYQFPGKEQRYRLIVGWDPTLSSFFAQVEDLAWETDGRAIDKDAAIGDSPDEGLLVRVGAASPVTDVEQIIRAVSAYGTISNDILQRLRQEQQANKPLTKAHVPPQIMRDAEKRFSKRKK